MPDVAILDSTTGGAAIRLLHSLADARRYSVTAIDIGRGGVTRYSRHCRHVRVPNWRWEAGPEQLDALAKSMPGTVLLPVMLEAVEWMSVHADALARRWLLPALPEPDAFRTAADKLLLGEFARKLGIPVPAFAPLRNVASKAAGIAFPALLKPRRGLGGEGIERIVSRVHLEQRIAQLGRAEDFLLQTFVDGSDAGCGLLAQDGRIVAIAAYQGLAQEREFAPASTVAFFHSPEVERIAEALIRGLRWNGLMNLDFRRDREGRFHLLEANPRTWLNLLASTAHGLNFADLWCRSAVSQLEGLPPLTRGRFCHSWDFVRGTTGWKDSALRFIARDPLPHLELIRRAALSRF